MSSHPPIPAPKPVIIICTSRKIVRFSKTAHDFSSVSKNMR